MSSVEAKLETLTLERRLGVTLKLWYSSNIMQLLSRKSNSWCVAQSIRLASPQAAWLSIFFVGNSVVLHLFEGPELRMHYREDREEKKSPAHSRI